MSETAVEKPAFRDAMSLRRCLIPADAFFEWKRLGPKNKRPYIRAQLLLTGVCAQNRVNESSCQRTDQL